MPLIQILEKSPEVIMQYNIKQIVNAAGDGVLSDNSECSKELKHYLSNASVEKLSEHVKYCLDNSFEKSGQVLQDIVNEMGRRLEYDVENGLYQGKQNQIGYDGIWKAPNGHSLVVEIKTTDAYRINLNTIAGYRSRLIDSNKVTDKSSILIVVGRNDTGDLEAQIRGSKHAWDTRVISVEALLKLVQLNVSSDESETTEKIRSLLVPFEYTRLDEIINVVFATAKDVESALETEDQLIEESQQNPESVKQEHTSRDILDAVRSRIIETINKREEVSLVAYKRAQFGSRDKKVRVVCPVSKQYNGKGYWFAYHPRYNIFLEDAEKGFFALGCIGQEFSYAIPYKIMAKLLPSLNVTQKEDNKTYWHIHLEPKGKDSFDLVLKKGEIFNLEPYKINII